MIKIKNIYHLKDVLLRGEDSFFVALKNGGFSHPYIYYNKSYMRFCVTYEAILPSNDYTDEEVEDGKEYTDVELLNNEIIGCALKEGRLYLED